MRKGEVMLDVLRKNSRHWLVMALMALVVVGLTAFFGYSNRESSGGQTWAAKIDGDTIKMGEYITRYRNVVEMYRKKIGPEFDEKLIRQLNIKFQILSGMVMDRVVSKEAKNNGLGISTDELRNSIANVSYFQKDGKFSMDYYKGMLAYNRMSANEFENIQKRDMLKEKLQRFVVASSKVSEEELNAAYRVENQKIKLAYMKVNASPDLITEVKKEEIKSFLATEQGKKEAQDYYTKHNNFFIDTKKKERPVLKFEDVKEDIAKNILSMKKEQQAIGAKTEEALKTADITKAAKILNSKVEQTAPISRKMSSIAGIPSSNTNDVLWAFGIGSKLSKREIGGSTYILVIKETESAKSKMPEKDYDNFKKNYISERGNAEFMSYMDGLKKKWSKKVEYSPVLLRDIRQGVEE